MAKNYAERLAETRARSYEENLRLYEQRLANNQDVGVLERVLREQARTQGLASSDESDSCAGSRIGL
ncbi:MAG: hypothetical protein PHH00_01610 [Candidatus Nanoarchaeia archaeon]|nr:hypothetical protein [Candidatus Nanoarchaeia archaeon]